MLIAIIGIMFAMVTAVLVSYQAGVARGKTMQTCNEERIIHTETISIDEDKWCYITKSFDRKI